MRTNTSKKSVTKLLVGLIFSIYLVIGLTIYRDYGIPWDDPIQKKYGEDTYNYITRRNQKLLKNKDRYYGPAFELGITATQKILKLEDPQNIYLHRHLFVFLTFFVSTIFFYKLCRLRFDSTLLGLIGTSFLVLSPRIFAHSFYNTKDLPLLSFFIIGSYTSYRFLNDLNYKNAITHALVCAILIDIRIVGIILPISTVIVLTLNMLTRKEVAINALSLRNYDRAKVMGAFLGMVTLATIMFWPTLWKNPIENFIEAFRQMSQYPQSTSILYFGEELKSTKLPWHYTLGWIIVTTPILYQNLAVLGIATFVKRCLAAQKTTIKQRLDIQMALLLFVPVFAVIYFKSVLYDGWRQMFFIYPMIVYFGVMGVAKLLEINRSIIYKAILLSILIINAISVSTFMVRIHPLQNMYFNKFAGSPQDLSTNFEQDYWGLSYKMGLEHIAKTDNRQQIIVRAKNFPGKMNELILDSRTRDRLIVGEKVEDPDYLITNYRGDKNKYTMPLVYSVLANQTRVLGVYKLK